mmetsp:Transcript_2815/g.9203  ORF Transcript_2815/g.9203 Transcript_2815/m.9203 type:complete len:1167 (-) Transcript_2815:1810-5310(-)
MRRGARCVIALVVMACAATLGARADADPAHGVSEGDGSALSGRRAAVQGAHSFLTLVVVSADVALGDGDAATLTKILKTQIEAYFTWASYGTMTPSVDLYLYQSPNSELEDGTTCKTLGAMTPDPWNEDIEHAVTGTKDYQAKYNSFISKKNMRQVLYLTNSCVGSCESGQNGISCQQKYSNLLTCTNPDSTTAACDSTGIHEMLHAIGLKYHAGGYKCTQSDYDDASITWRTCPFEDYGGVFDVLGSSSDSYGKKMGQGVQSYSRWDMHWLSNTNVKVITKTNGQVTDVAPDVSKTCILSPLDVDSTDSSTTRACVIQFSDTTMSSLGTIWLESRRGNKFDDLIVNGEHGRFNSLGVLGFHEGRKLIDFYPYDSSGGTEAGEKYNDWEQTALRSTENGGVWEDPVSGLKLTVNPYDGDTDTINVTVTFTQPAACVKRGAAAYPSQFNGYQMDVAYVDDDELEKYHPKNHLDLDGWPYAAYYSATSTQAISASFYNQYIPYAPNGAQKEAGVQESCYKLAITYKMSVQNLDYGVCAQSRLTVRALNLPAGWRVDAGACTNIIGAQGIIDDICFTVAVPRDTPDGAYEIRIQAAQINDSDKAVMTASETVPLLVCVGGFNYPYQSWDDTTSAGKWTCDYGAKGSKTRATIALGNIQNRAANTYEPSSTYYPTSNVAAAKSNREQFFLRNPEVTNDGADRLQDMSSLYSADEDDDRCYAVEATRYCGEDEFVWAQFWCAACPSGSTRPAGDDSWLVDGETSCTCPHGSTWTLGRCLCTTGEYYDSSDSCGGCERDEYPDADGNCVTISCESGKYLSTDSYACENCATGYDTCTSASEGSTCSANYHVSDGACVACGANSQNDAGDDIDDGNSKCDCDEEYSLVDGVCTKQVSIDVKIDFAGITGAIDTTLEQKLIDSLTSGIEGSDGFDATASEVAITYKISAKQTFAAAVDENAFKTAAASSLSVSASDIINFSQTAARRRLLSNVVTYDVSTTNRATANSVNTAAAAAITIGGATGTPATPTTTLAFAVTYTVPSSALSTVQSTVMSSSFTTSVNTAATTAGVSGVTVSVPPCTGIVAPTNGALGTCTTQLSNGESCVPVCNGDYELQGVPTMCVSGVLSAATCQAPSSSGGGGTPSPFDFGLSPANTIRFGVSSALIAAFTLVAA